MPSVTAAKGRKAKGSRPADRVDETDQIRQVDEVDGTDQVDETDGSDGHSDLDSGASDSGADSSADSGADSGPDSGSDSDSLDSTGPRKRRRTSPAARGDAEPSIIKSAFNVPSRIIRKPQPAAEADAACPTDPEPEPESRVTAPLDANTTFDSLGLRPWLVQSLATMAIKRPTAIQRESIPMLLKGRDCIGGSRTGSGKTVAFAAPILQQWAENPSAIFAVILTPTRCVRILILLPSDPC